MTAHFYILSSLFPYLNLKSTLVKSANTRHRSRCPKTISLFSCVFIWWAIDSIICMVELRFKSFSTALRYKATRTPDSAASFKLCLIKSSAWNIQFCYDVNYWFHTLNNSFTLFVHYHFLILASFLPLNVLLWILVQNV